MRLQTIPRFSVWFVIYTSFPSNIRTFYVLSLDKYVPVCMYCAQLFFCFFNVTIFICSHLLHFTLIHPKNPSATTTTTTTNAYCGNDNNEMLRTQSQNDLKCMIFRWSNHMIITHLLFGWFCLWNNGMCKSLCKWLKSARINHNEVRGKKTNSARKINKRFWIELKKHLINCLLKSHLFI